MDKVLVIAGPTATGKTNLGLTLAKGYNGALISADSRQIYQDLDIGTGKEVDLLRFGHARKGQGCWIINGITVYGYDLIDCRKQFSAVDFAHMAQAVIAKITEAGRLPIVVGGTGFYVKTLLDGLGSSGTGRDDHLRNQLSHKTITELQAILQNSAAKRLAWMNQSDRNNPRRLVRQIELAQATASGIALPALPCHALSIGLMMPPRALAEKITKRVSLMVEQGLVNEIQKVLERGFGWESPGLRTIGYQEFAGYFKHHEPIESVITAITRHQVQYAKRQMTWFKRDNRIVWFDITSQNWQGKLEDTVERWYNARVKEERVKGKATMLKQMD